MIAIPLYPRGVERATIVVESKACIIHTLSVFGFRLKLADRLDGRRPFSFAFFGFGRNELLLCHGKQVEECIIEIKSRWKLIKHEEKHDRH